ncbi:MAG: formyltransferase family protein [Flavobacteriales bacterium]
MTLPVYLLLSEKSWHDELFANLQTRVPAQWHRIRQRDEFNESKLQSINPELIFIPHWSYIIPAEIYDHFTCVVFHMTDLPYGRGGSPLQNLIVRGHKETQISAIRVGKGIDTGPVYLKKPLSLHGTAEEIFIRSTKVIEEIIVEIVEQKPEPQEQKGEAVLFERRKPEDGNLNQCQSIEQAYDYIRMLDAEGYPAAFIETERFRFEFSRASLKNGKKILADVRIIEK